MKLFSLYSEEVTPLKENWFLPSLQDNWDLHLENIGNLSDGEGVFLSRGWFQCIRRKHEIILEAIENNFGEIILWSDIDIQFFGKCAPFVADAMQSHDVVFQAERLQTEEANTGFIAIRCNESTRKFFLKPLEFEPEEHDQTYQKLVNELLQGEFHDRLNWGRFPRQVWARSEGWLPPAPFNENFPECIPLDLVLHHANCASNLEEKVAQLNEVRNYVLSARSTVLL